MTPMSAEGLHAGSVLGDYRLEALLACGGMGVVYTARQVSVDRRVALKVIAPALAEDESLRRRFERESRVAIEIEHPNIVPVYATGAAEGLLFIAMRYIDGRDLRRVVDAESPMSPKRVLALLEQIASGLDAAHRKGLVHRDVKPANVMVERLGADREHCYVLDFGLAKQSGSGGLTRTGGWVGTLDYVAPEQVLGKEVDARTDVYALGATFFHMVTGQPPYAMRDDGAKLYAHVNARVPRVTDIRAELPAAVDDVIARALAKEPGKRYPSAGDFARAAHGAITGSPLSAFEQSVATGEAAPTNGSERTSQRVSSVRPSRTDVSGEQPPPGRAVRDVTVVDHTTEGEHGVGSSTGDHVKKGRTTRWPLPRSVGLALLALAGAGAATLVSRSSRSATHQVASGRLPVQRSTARSAPAQHRPAGNQKPKTSVRHASQASVAAAQPPLVPGGHGTPMATTGSASSVTATAATLAGTVNPNGAALTYHVDYGLTTAYDAATADHSAGSGTAPVSVSVPLSGLDPATKYHYRIVASTRVGSAIGSDETFNTKAPKFSAVQFTGTPTNPTVTITGSNFGTIPRANPSTPLSCEPGDTSVDYGISGLWFKDVTAGWTAGQIGDCIGLNVTSYTNTKIVYQFGAGYGHYDALVTHGDAFKLTVWGVSHTGTVAYS
jgi:serine/threonine protein kinase